MLERRSNHFRLRSSRIVLPSLHSDIWCSFIRRRRPRSSFGRLCPCQDEVLHDINEPFYIEATVGIDEDNRTFEA